MLRGALPGNAFDSSTTAWRWRVETPSRNEGKACSLSASFPRLGIVPSGPTGCTAGCSALGNLLPVGCVLRCLLRGKCLSLCCIPVCARASICRLIWKPARALGAGRRRTWKSSCPGNGVRKSARPTQPRGDRPEARAAPTLLRTRLQRGGPGSPPGVVGPPAGLEPGATLPAGVSGFGLAQCRRTSPLVWSGDGRWLAAVGVGACAWHLKPRDP